jgi:hypothetical protein
MQKEKPRSLDGEAPIFDILSKSSCQSMKSIVAVLQRCKKMPGSRWRWAKVRNVKSMLRDLAKMEMRDPEEQADEVKV